jgi:hypothetical protein
LLVYALYQQFKEEGESFKPKYLKILSAGGSEAPERILKEAGVNIRDPKFWQGGFNVLEKLVSELEKLPVASVKRDVKSVKSKKAKPAAKKSVKKVAAKKPAKKATAKKVVTKSPKGKKKK